MTALPPPRFSPAAAFLSVIPSASRRESATASCQESYVQTRQPPRAGPRTVECTAMLMVRPLRLPLTTCSVSCGSWAGRTDIGVSSWDRGENVWRSCGPPSILPRARRGSNGVATLIRAKRAAAASVEEVTLSGEVHRHTGRLCGLDHFVVPDAAAGLDDGADAGVDQDLRAIGE